MPGAPNVNVKLTIKSEIYQYTLSTVIYPTKLPCEDPEGIIDRVGRGQKVTFSRSVLTATNLRRRKMRVIRSNFLATLNFPKQVQLLT